MLVGVPFSLVAGGREPYIGLGSVLPSEQERQNEITVGESFFVRWNRCNAFNCRNWAVYYKPLVQKHFLLKRTAGKGIVVISTLCI